MTTSLLDELQHSLEPAYVIQRELGGGGMARVFLAEETALERLVVIKVLPPDIGVELRVDRFVREIRLAARLQHPHIVPLFTAGQAGSLPYYTMPYVDGESLGARIARDGLLPIAIVMRILRDVARGLEYAHARDVVHRDIKPDNVLLSGNAAAVTDFGIAKALTVARAGASGETFSAQSVTQIGFAVGTPAYMAPEQGVGDPLLDHRADLYSLGCVAYELLSGQAPFAGRSPAALLVAHAIETPKSLADLKPDIPDELADLVMACLEKEPANRPRSATEVLSVIESDTSERRIRPVSRHAASVAVLPFSSMSDDKDDEYFADGVTEEIINLLAQANGLRVVGRTSSFSFKGTRADIATIGQKLNAESVLEGSVRRIGTRLRITAQLVNVRDGFPLWSDRYDRELVDVFAVQDEIAVAIATQLRTTLTRNADQSQRPTNNLEAFELFLKGRIHFHRRGRHIRTALECFQRAVALDPNFAQAHIALADALSLAGFYGVVKPSLIMTSAHASALQAVERAPELAESHAALALWLTLYSSERDEALARWDKAMSIGSPTPQVRCSYALWRCGLLDQRWAEARDVTYQALASDPLSGYAHTMIAMLKMAAQDTEGLLDAAQRGVELDNESFWSQWGLQRAYHAVGMREEAIAHGALVTVNFGRHPWAMGDLAFAHAAGGDPAAAEALYDELMLRARTEWVAAGSLAFTATQAGRLDDALAHCERAVAERDAFVRWAPLQEYSGWAPLYTHPGWPPVRRRILDW